MTASKSSRARNARAQANAARTGGSARTATAVKAGSSGRTAVAVKAPAPVKAGTVKASTVRASTVKANGSTGAETQRWSAAPFWMQITTWLVAVAGLGVSIYLTIAHFTETVLAGCSESGLVNCTKVTTSPQSYVFGIPVAVLGLAFYLFAVAAMSPWAWRSRRREVHIVRLASTVVGIGFVLYLIYAELFIIGSICLYCTSVHVLTFVLFALTAFAAAAWGLDPAKRDS
ncbi:MAG: vitamin K epoxide reductase family protein [Streptosporangiaceae bacterium]